MMFTNDFDLVRDNADFRMRVIFSVSDYIEKYGAGLFDISELKFDKELILFAYLFEIATNKNKDAVELFAAGATLLASFQRNVGNKRLTSSEFEKLLSAPLFQSGEISEADRKALSKKIEIMQIFKLSSNERMIIIERIKEAMYLNNSIQSPMERIRRRVWKFLRPCIYAIAIFILIILSFPIFVIRVLSNRKNNSAPSAFSDWMNWLSEKPRYEWDHISVDFRLPPSRA